MPGTLEMQIADISESTFEDVPADRLTDDPDLVAPIFVDQAWGSDGLEIGFSCAGSASLSGGVCGPCACGGPCL